MTRRIVGWGSGFAFLVLLLACAGGAALANEGEDGPPSLEKRIAELRAKAHALRERGSVEDAEAVAKRATILEKVQALRRESAELERRGKDLRADGREEDAHRALAESGRLWKRSEELLRSVEGGPGRPAAKERPEGRPEQVDRKIRQLEEKVIRLREEGNREEATETERLLALLRAARHVEGGPVAHRGHVERAERVKKAIALLREAGLPDLASLVERETKEITRPPPAMPRFVVRRGGPLESILVRSGEPHAQGEIERLRREVEAIRRQVEEIQAVLRELRERR